MKRKSSNKDLRKANSAKKDEFYTQLVDIENEMKPNSISKRNTIS